MYTGRYEVTSQTHAQDLTPDGRFADVVTVNFQTPSGTHSYVTVPLAGADPGNIDKLIRDKIEQIEGIHALGDSPHPDIAG